MDKYRFIYKDDIDFSALALQNSDFNRFLKSNGQLDFSNPEAVQQLTKSLLKRDFGLDLHLPDDRLCPPVPNRLNYIFWVQDLLDSTSDTFTDRYDPEQDVIGLDMYKGTGASCIYPLLGCTLRPKWKFAATDIDEKNLQYARQNIVANALKSRIRPLKTIPADLLIPLDFLGIDSISFTICNPPFYASVNELLTSAAAKSRPPHSACTGAEVEMVTDGGEVVFVSRMIEESCVLKERIQWYTSMLGKSSSVVSIVEKLREKGIENWAVKTFVQGEKTRRWGIAWSWGDLRPKMEVARAAPTLPKHLLPYPSEFGFSIASVSIESVASQLNSTLQGLDLSWQYRSMISTGIGFALGNVWSRSARRSKLKHAIVSPSSPQAKSVINGGPNQVDEEEDEEDSEPALGFKIQIQPGKEMNEIEVAIRWLKGRQSVLYESFCGMLKRQISQDATR